MIVLSKQNLLILTGPLTFFKHKIFVAKECVSKCSFQNYVSLLTTVERRALNVAERFAILKLGIGSL